MATSERRSRPFLTKYEFNQIIGLRTTHLSKGAPPLIDLPPDFTIKSNMDYRAIALKEILTGYLPYIVKRRMPNGKYEQWKLSELDLVAVRHLLREA
jgi:DNA-directed RNA polymerases I, II, and III subunit RPABC2